MVPPSRGMASRIGIQLQPTLLTFGKIGQVQRGLLAAHSAVIMAAAGEAAA